MDKERLDELEMMLLQFVMEYGTPYTTIHYSAERGLKVYEDEKARKEWNALWRGDDEKPKYRLGDMLQSKNKDRVCFIVGGCAYIDKCLIPYLKVKYMSGDYDGMVQYISLKYLETHYHIIGNILDKGAKK